jgi:hypothetical protein
MTVSGLAKVAKLLPMRGREPFLTWAFCPGSVLAVILPEASNLVIELAVIGRRVGDRISTHGVV